MFKRGQTLLVTRDWEDNNTRGKLGIILDDWENNYNIGFFKELKMSNGEERRYVDKYPDVKSTWWVRSYLLKSAISKNKFK